MDHLCHKLDAKVLEDEFKKGKKYVVKQLVDSIESMEIDRVEKEPEIKVKTEREEQHDIPEAKEEPTEEKRPKKHPAAEESSNESSTEPQPPAKVWRGLRYKTWTIGSMQPPTKYKKPTDKEITEVRTNIIVECTII